MATWLHACTAALTTSTGQRHAKALSALQKGVSRQKEPAEHLACALEAACNAACETYGPRNGSHRHLKRSRTRRRCLDPCGQPLFRLAASRCLRPASRREMPAPAPSRWQDASRVQRLRGLVGQLMGLSSSRCLGWIVKPRALGVKQAQRCLASGAQGLPRGTSLASSFLPRLSGTAEPCAVAKRSGQRHEDFRQAQRIKRL